MIELDHVSKVYQTDRIETMALDDITLRVARGELLAIMGPSGSGKSTLLHLMGLLDTPSRGQLRLDGTPIAGTSERALARLRNQRLGFVFQSFHLIPDLRVVDNVEIPLLYRRLGHRERRRQAHAALERVGLAARAHHFPTELSGGQQQRVAIARAIVGTPAVVLADEPTGNLDSAMGDEIMALLEGLAANDQTTVVMVTHDRRLAERCHRVVRLFDGRQVS